MKIVVLPLRVRTFKKVGRGSLVGRTGYHFEAGDQVEVGDVETVVYDHRDHLAVPVQFEGAAYYLLLDEMGSSQLTSVAVH